MHALIREALEHFGVLQRMREGLVQALDHRRGRSGLDDGAEPHARIQPVDAQFGHGGHVGHLGRALVGGDGQRLQALASDQRGGGDDRVEHEIDLTAHHVLQRRGGAFVGHVGEVAADLGAEHFAEQMADGAHTLRCER
ncbi:hypothetical protein SDC9_207952 [bioreactor metagenome]|uniref:Uncharacterized protein n=1 Tax=bioreactor metagenome TaxID=1076179 RepID=A0A645JA03_9ZZZZ